MFQNFIATTVVLVIAVVVVSDYKLCLAAKRSYKGYSVTRCWPQTSNQLDNLQTLKDDENISNGLEFWSEPVGINRTVDILVEPSTEKQLRELLDLWRISCRKTIPNVEAAIRRSTFTRSNIIRGQGVDELSNEANSSDYKDPNWDLDSTKFYRQFQAYPAIEAKLKALAKLDPRLTLETIGYSYEKRKLRLVRVSNNPRANKPVIFIDGGHHAREWISHSTALYLIESLINTDLPKMTRRDCRTTSCRAIVEQRIKLDLDNFDYWFVPVVNPDGYEYTHSEDRLWRKTRSKNSGVCFTINGSGRGDGVDPNRNYPFHWMQAGASSFACSEIYAGPRPLSEPETTALSRVILDNKSRISMYVSFHSFSQLILVPYGYGRVYPDNYNELQQVANRWIGTVAKLRNTRYEFGPSAIKLYPAAGGSDDYAHGVAGIKLAFTIELPDKGSRGFLLPPDQIIPVGHEAILGLRAMSDEALTLKRH